MAIAEDASTPAVLHKTSAGGTAVTASFSPPANSLVVVMVDWLWAAGSNPGTLSCKDSLGNTYAKPISAEYVPPPLWWQRPFSSGTSSAIFTRYYSSAPGAITVTAQAASADAASAAVAARVLTGAAASQANAGVARNFIAGAVWIDVVTSGSWAYCCGGRPGLGGVPVPAPSTTAIDSWQDSTSGNTAAAGRMSGSNTHPGVHGVGWLKHVGELSVLEVLPAALPTPPPQPAMTPFEVMTARLMNDWLTPDSVYKATATSIASSTTLAPDPDLTVQVEANAYYTWRCVLHTEGPAGADIALAFTQPAGASSGYLATAEAPAGTWGIAGQVPATAVNQVDTIGATSLVPVEMNGWLYTGATAGSFTLTWAQGTSNATACVVQSASYLTLWREG